MEFNYKVWLTFFNHCDDNQLKIFRLTSKTIQFYVNAHLNKRNCNLKLNSDCWLSIFDFCDYVQLHVLYCTCRTLNENINYYVGKLFKKSPGRVEAHEDDEPDEDELFKYTQRRQSKYIESRNSYDVATIEPNIFYMYQSQFLPIAGKLLFLPIFYHNKIAKRNVGTGYWLSDFYANLSFPLINWYGINNIRAALNTGYGVYNPANGQSGLDILLRWDNQSRSTKELIALTTYLVDNGLIPTIFLETYTRHSRDPRNLRYSRDCRNSRNCRNPPGLDNFQEEDSKRNLFSFCVFSGRVDLLISLIESSKVILPQVENIDTRDPIDVVMENTARTYRTDNANHANHVNRVHNIIQDHVIEGQVIEGEVIENHAIEDRERAMIEEAEFALELENYKLSILNLAVASNSIPMVQYISNALYNRKYKLLNLNDMTRWMGHTLGNKLGTLEDNLEILWGIDPLMIALATSDKMTQYIFNLEHKCWQNDGNRTKNREGQEVCWKCRPTHWDNYRVDEVRPSCPHYWEKDLIEKRSIKLLGPLLERGTKEEVLDRLLRFINDDFTGEDVLSIFYDIYKVNSYWEFSPVLKWMQKKGFLTQDLVTIFLKPILAKNAFRNLIRRPDENTTLPIEKIEQDMNICDCPDHCLARYLRDEFGFSNMTLFPNYEFINEQKIIIAERRAAQRDRRVQRRIYHRELMEEDQNEDQDQDQDLQPRMIGIRNPDYEHLVMSEEAIEEAIVDHGWRRIQREGNVEIPTQTDNINRNPTDSSNPQEMIMRDDNNLTRRDDNLNLAIPIENSDSDLAHSMSEDDNSDFAERKEKEC